MKLLLFGNPAIPSDALALKVGRALEKEYETRRAQDPLELLDLELDEYVILDVAIGAPDVKLITDVDRLVLGRLVSLHDFDMAYFLKLLKELGRLPELRIIALPPELPVALAVEKTRRILQNL